MDFSLAISLDKSDEQNYRFRALCYHNLNKHEKALSDYSHSLRILTDQLPTQEDKKATELILAETHFQRGNTYLIKRKNYEACQDFLRSYNLGAKKGLNYYRKYCNVY
jgi:tetratricopeptide (TPR) repeat protein